MVEHKPTNKPPCGVCGRDGYFCFCDPIDELTTVYESDEDFTDGQDQ